MGILKDIPRIILKAIKGFLVFSGRIYLILKVLEYLNYYGKSIVKLGMKMVRARRHRHKQSNETNFVNFGAIYWKI